MEIDIIGCGGHGEVVLDILRAAGQHRVIGFLDSDPATHGRLVDGVKVLGPPAVADAPFVVAVGDNRVRKNITETLVAKGLEPVTVVHPTASVASTAIIGPGTVICAGAVVCTHARIGQGVIVNTGAVVEHHNVVGDFVHLAPGVVLTGHVCVEEGAFVGAGATVIKSCTVGSWSKVGAGALVNRGVPTGETYVGVPAKPLRKHA